MAKSPLMETLKAGRTYRLTGYIRTPDGTAIIMRDTNGKEIWRSKPIAGWQNFVSEFTPTSEEYDIDMNGVSLGDLTNIQLVSMVQTSIDLGMEEGTDHG